MIVVLKQNVKAEQIEELTKQIEAKGLKVSPVIGTEKSILGYLPKYPNILCQVS